MSQFYITYLLQIFNLLQPGPFIQMQICFSTKEKKNIGKYMAKLTFLWYDNFGNKERSLHRNGMAAITKTRKTDNAYL